MSTNSAASTPPRPGSGERPFEILPAIDLRGGRVVRLRHGEFDRETAYSDDPPAVADAFVAAGSTWLHVVDLDGARDGEPRQALTIRAICKRVGGRARVEVAGGLRTAEAVAAVLAAGADRIVVGTAALRDPGFAGRIVETHGGGRIVAALDVRDGLALGEGWRRGAAGLPPDEALRRLAAEGVEVFEVTAVARDGSLSGPDLGLLAGLVELDRGAVIASGGIASIDDLCAVRQLGCAGAIVGRAIYERRLDLRAALEFAAARG